jgi:TRAP-type mannitol/chloroaromatic compound transport system permease large subunit
MPTVPIRLSIFRPIPARAKIGPMWFATLVVTIIQTGYPTPPMASPIFDLRSFAPREIGHGEGGEGVEALVAAPLLGSALVLAFPALVTRLSKALVTGF